MLQTANTLPASPHSKIAHRLNLETLKIACITEGLRMTPAALSMISDNGTQPLTLHEYPTTGGITLELPENVYLNAPFDEWYCVDAKAQLDVVGSQLVLRHGSIESEVVRLLPLPGYLDQEDGEGNKAGHVAMSHCDRVRLSPVRGCAYDCGFCDIPDSPYSVRAANQLNAALDIALEDTGLPARHALLSGGSPRRAHYEAFENVCVEIVKHSPVPVDLMMSPMIDNLGFIDRLAASGLAGMSINLEVQSPVQANDLLGKKYRTTRTHFAPFVERAVNRLGVGNVRSAIIPGLEPLESTLEGIEFLASLGCLPAISPFRPTSDIRLRMLHPPSVSAMTTLLHESRSIVARHGITLGPTCVPCLHNILAMPWDVTANV